jgi:hypothetical protein
VPPHSLLLTPSTLVARRKWLGHAWIIIKFDDGTIIGMENTLQGGRKIYKKGDKDFEKALKREFDDERVANFDEKSYGGKNGVIETIKGGTRKDYNLITHNCCTFSMCVWFALTGEWLTDTPDPDQVSKRIRDLNERDRKKKKKKSGIMRAPNEKEWAALGR